LVVLMSLPAMVSNVHASVVMMGAAVSTGAGSVTSPIAPLVIAGDVVLRESLEQDAMVRASPAIAAIASRVKPRPASDNLTSRKPGIFENVRDGNSRGVGSMQPPA
jgi:hypothetical protein